MEETLQAQWLGSFITLAEDPGSITSIHMVAYNLI